MHCPDRSHPTRAPIRCAGATRVVVRSSVRLTAGRDLLVLATVLCVIAGAALAVSRSGLRIQHTGSLPRGLYREEAGAPVRGAIGMWCLPAGWATWARTRGYLGPGGCPGGTEPVGKVVLATEGDTVVMRERGVWLNRRRVPSSRPLRRDGRGRVLPVASYGLYVLRAEEVWLWSPCTPRSFDSRYFGPVSVRALVALVRPVWTVGAGACARVGGE
jgi:conjugative transfer signal peptidase TraF